MRYLIILFCLFYFPANTWAQRLPQKPTTHKRAFNIHLQLDKPTPPHILFIWQDGRTSYTMESVNNSHSSKTTKVYTLYESVTGEACDFKLIIGTPEQLAAFPKSHLKGGPIGWTEAIDYYNKGAMVKDVHCVLPEGDIYLKYSNGTLRQTNAQTSAKPWQLPLTAQTSGEGVGVLSDNTATLDDKEMEEMFDLNYGYDAYDYYTKSYLAKTKKIIYTEKNGKTFASFQQPSPSRKRKANTGLFFETSLGFENNHALPQMQKQYAQGNNNVWNGPNGDFPNVVSPSAWGPALSELSFDGTPTVFDRNGSLVPNGSSAALGGPAKAYSTDHFFRTGFNTKNFLSISLPSFLKGQIKVDLGQSLRKSPIPNSQTKTYNAKLLWSDLQLGKYIKMTLSTSYNHQKGDLVNRGSNLTEIMQSLLLTPPSFDLLNGMSRKDALANRTNQLGNGLQNGSNYFANPYTMVFDSPDQEKNQDWLSAIHWSIMPKKNQWDSKWSISPSVWYQKTWDNRTNSLSNVKSNIWTQTAKDVTETLGWKVAGQYRIYTSRENIYLNARYQGQRQQTSIDRIEDRLLISHESFRQKFVRRPHEIDYSADTYFGNYKLLFLKLSNRHYFSNTAEGYTNLFPAIEARLDLQRLLGLGYNYRLNLCLLANRSINEAPLLYTNTAIIPALRDTRDFTVIYPKSGILPELSNKIDVGFNFAWRDVSVSAYYAYGITDNYIAPVETALPMDKSTFDLQNVAQISSNSFNVGATYMLRLGYDVRLETQLAWSLTRNKVRSLSTNSTFPYLQMAGLSSAFTALAPDASVGAIYGTQYLRNANGDRILDTDGLPSIKQGFHQIGDALPDWVASLSSTLIWKKLRFNFNFDYNQGGDVWNGTRATMDYYGTSQASADARNASGGSLHTQKEFQAGGSYGVGEAYIEDASYLRLSNLGINYSFDVNVGPLYEISVGANARNLFVYAPNTSADPSSNLFNNPMGAGLNWFNLPSTRMFLFTIGFKLN